MTPQLPNRTGIAAALALTLAALLAISSPALAQPIDLRSPDARSAGATTAAQGDQRSPDARAAGRSDALPTLGPPTWPEDPFTITSDEPDATVADVSSSEFEWADAAVGAGGALGFVLLLAGAVAFVSRRHRATPGRVATS